MGIGGLHPPYGNAFLEQRRQRPALDELHGEIGPAVGEGAELVDRNDAGMLQLAADLGFFDEATDQLGLVVVAFEQDLDGQVAAQVGVAPLENGTHAAAGDLAKKLVPVATLARPGHLVGRRLDHRQANVVHRRVGKQDARNRPDRPGQALEDMSGHGRLKPEGRVLAHRLKPGAEHADRAGAVMGITRKRVSTTVAAANFSHCSGSGKEILGRGPRREETGI